jgi:hypothetical protein
LVPSALEPINAVADAVASKAHRVAKLKVGVLVGEEEGFFV